MPWATFETGSKFCVYQLDADNNKKGESLECFDSRPEAQNYVKGLYAKEKAGARHSTNDNSLIQKAHDALCELGAACKEQPRGIGAFDSVDKLAIFKQADGRHRWVLFSSSAFQDKDGEFVTQKALEQDSERMTHTGEYGPLRWWHIGEPDPITKKAGPGLDIGDCDFSAMHGKMSIESGTFRDEFFGERLAPIQDELEVSRGFFHPFNEPDKEDAFWNIHTFERSLLPRGKASNLLTRFFAFNHKESTNMADMTLENVKAFIRKLGGDTAAENKVGEILSTADMHEKGADKAGRAYKTEGTLLSEDSGGTLSVTNVATKADGDKPEDEKPSAVTEDSVKALINKAFAEYDAKQSAKKEENDAATTKATNDIAVSLKAIADGQTAITTAQGELKEAVAMALTGVAELKGELPRKLTDPREFYRPSQDGPKPGGNLQESIAQMLQSQKDFQGEADPFAKFTNSIFNQSQPQQFVAPNAPKGN